MLDDLIRKVSAEKHRFQTSDVVAASGGKYSRPYVSSVLSRLVAAGQLLRQGAGKYTFYVLPEFARSLQTAFHRRYVNSGLDEYAVLEQIKLNAPSIRAVHENVVSTIDYAFSEMLNNAVEHSGSKSIEITFGEAAGRIVFKVKDHGIGVFRNVMRSRGLDSELEAIQDLLKGKTTTQPQSHSGEGIFFTSKAGDLFELESYGYRLRVDNLLPDIFVESVKSSVRGTTVTFSIDKRSNRHLSDVFTAYQSDAQEIAFDKTYIHVRLFITGTVYISRSQARRVLSGLEKFRAIDLDFERVPTIGQAFADEVFRVFKSIHPEIDVRPLNMNESVAFMVARARNTVR